MAKKVNINISNMHVLSQLTAAHKATIACARLGLTVQHVRLEAGIPTLEVQHNAVTEKWLQKNKAWVYMHAHDAKEQFTSTAQRMICGCRVIFSFIRKNHQKVH